MEVEIFRMLFVLLLVGMVGGFALLVPLVRRLSKVLEQRLNDRGRGELPTEQIRKLQAAIEGLSADLDQLAERQQFTEALLAEQPANRLVGAATPRANGIAGETDS